MRNMMKLKDIEKGLGNKCWRTDNGQKLCILSCAVGDNFYNYGEPTPKEIDWSRYPSLKDDPRIVIVNCEYCCCCAGW